MRSKIADRIMAAKPRPILFSTDMVRAILAGTKTQTRRVVKPQPHSYGTEIIDSGRPWFKGKGRWHNRFVVSEDPKRYEIASTHDCPYGKVGDVLWVRETFYLEKYFNGLGEGFFPKYKADFNEPVGWNWKPSIHIPRWAARIWLQITELRIERLQDITEEDAIAEGIEELNIYSFTIYKDYTKGSTIDGFQYAPNSYKSLWDSINYTKPTANCLLPTANWENNPWVWVIKFKVLSTTGMTAEALAQVGKPLEPRPEETNYLTKTVLQGSADESERIESLKNVPGAGVREFDTNSKSKI